LAASETVVIVGESAITNRDLRATSISGLWILDRQAWRALDYLCLGPYGQVHEVRILDRPDLAHNASPFAGLPTFLSQGPFARERSSKLATEVRKREYPNLEVVFGDPLPDADGWFAGSQDALCLVLAKTPPRATGIAFTYDLNQAKQGNHVSGILAYRGEREDRWMLAVLLQFNGEITSAALWLNDGQTWVRADQPPIMSAPNAGNAQICPSREQIVVSIDEIECGRFAVTGRDLSGGVGVRWMNARVRNIRGLNEEAS
jgi:hypothetical protein